MKKLLILGSRGMLGHMVFEYLHSLNKYQVRDVCREPKLRKASCNIDVFDKEDIINYILNSRPDVIINCIGVLGKYSEQNPARAVYINSYIPHVLSNCAESVKGKLINISTAKVFEGEGKHTENWLPDATGMYGRSKALGETRNPDDLTIRTSLIGPELPFKDGTGLFDWFMRQQKPVNGYSKALWNGITTLEMAKVLDALIDQDIKGLLHVGTKTPIDKCSLLRSIGAIWEKDTVITPVKQPKLNRVLSSSRKDFDYIVPEIQYQLFELHKWMEERKDLYKKYYE